MANFDPNSVTGLVGLWDFRNGATEKDIGVADGLEQDGSFEGGASASGGRANFDGNNDRFDVDGDNGGPLEQVFDLSKATIEVQFRPDEDDDDQTIVNRGEFADRGSEGYFAINALDDGEIQVQHILPGGPTVTLTTPDDFYDDDDLINVVYSFDSTTGATLVVENLSEGTSTTLSSNQTGLTLDIGDNDDEIFTFGARENNDGSYNQHFDGTIDYVAVYGVDTIAPDGAVDGEATGEFMPLGYDDSNDPTNQGGDIITEEADLIFGNGGNDTIEGAGGNDTIYGDFGPDGPTPNLVRESFEWDKLPDPNSGGGIDDGDPVTDVTQNTGNVVVGFKVLTGLENTNEYATDTQFVAGIDTGSEAINPNSGFVSNLDDGSNEDASFELTFDEEVQNVDFRVNDVDQSANVVIRAFDADGNEVPVTFTLGDNLDPITNGFESGVIEDSEEDDPDFSALVEVAGPVARIVIEHSEDSANSGIWFSDVYFDAPDGTFVEGVAGNDDIIGGAGADVMFGEDGDDEFIIETREDAFGDQISGGNGPDDTADDDVLDLRGLGRFEFSTMTDGTDTDAIKGTVNFLDDDGNVEGTLTFNQIETFIPCFTPGSLIATPRGEVRVEELQPGDRVITRDDGIQEIHWVGSKVLTSKDLVADPKLKPVLIKKGALGNGLPERDMLVSANHRMLIVNENTQMLFNEREVLVAAKHMVERPGVQRVNALGVEYVHVMFERHQVILADGSWTESFQPGDQTISGFDKEQREEIFKLFPDLQHEDGVAAYGAARQSLKAHEARMLHATAAE